MSITRWTPSAICTIRVGRCLLGVCPPVLAATLFCTQTWVSFPFPGSGCTGSSRVHRHRHALRSTATPISLDPSEKRRALSALGLDPANAPQPADVKRAFRRKVARLHPDVKGGKASAQFREVLDAYALLTGRRTSLATSTPSSDTPFSEIVKTRGPTEEEQEAEFQRPENWRWNQNTGYNPGDLDEVWDEIGYNPYTGEYRTPPERPEEQEWVPPPSWTVRTPSSPPPPQPAPTPRRRSAKARGMEYAQLPTVEILGYFLLAAVCIFLALSPELLLSEEDKARYLEQQEQRARLEFQRRQERAALEILWRQRQFKWQQEQMRGFAEYSEADEPAGDGLDEIPLGG
ncbi:unnamed protein product [Effrenium voratum]|nr:unnamed protein product [Effrenium voratum]